MGRRPARRARILTPAALHRGMAVNRPALRRLLGECEGHWVYEDRVYRFYHQSFKVYDLQQKTQQIVECLQTLAPGFSMNAWFLHIVQEGTSKRFSLAANRRWLVETRPILEAFFHARYFLEMAVRYGKKRCPSLNQMPSGWAALLYLYNIR